MPRPRTFDEDAVIAASRVTFHERGYAATSMDELTAATGLGRGSIYSTFGDKHAIFMRALDAYCDDILSKVRDDLQNAELSAVDRLSGHILRIATDLASGKAGMGCFMARSAAELAASDAEVASRARATVDGWLAELTSTLIEAQRDGAIAPDAEPEALASLLLAVLRGIDALRVQGGSPAVITAAARQVLALLPLTSAYE